MRRPEYWNHNTAYYPWIHKQLTDCHSILDVGCGIGTLAFFLDDGIKEIVGIDVDENCIDRALSSKGQAKADFICCSFENYEPTRTFDAVVFVASLHHMDMTQALKKAKTLLSPGGKLLIVGISKPSSLADYFLAAVRVIPSAVISRLHHTTSSEELNVPVYNVYPSMSEVRHIMKEELPNAKIRYGLHYRYLLEWTA
jgi:2-polyprenyl-3-methyl-5-hydroxy-6-metoxy-1,4-benzoquinol methylase